LYEPFVAGIGDFDFGVLIPGGIGGLATVILFAKAVDMLFKKHYSVAFHAIVGVVIAATVMIIPVQSFAASVSSCIVNVMCLAVGVVAALLLDKFNQKYAVK
jgi:putative membrane protein